MPLKRKKEKNTVVSLALSVCFSCAIMIILMLVEALVLGFFKDPLTYVRPLAIVFMALSFILSGIVSSKLTGEHFFSPLITSGVMTLILLAVSLIIESEGYPFMISLAIRFGMIALSLLGALLARKRKKQVTGVSKYKKMMARR